MEFKFAQSTTERLNPSDLEFFYYDVAIWNNTLRIELPNDDLIFAAEKIGITLLPKGSRSNIRVEPTTNTIVFCKNSNELFGEALFRHFRNSFAHYKITYANANTDFSFVDKTPRGRTTMVGLVNKEKFKALILKMQEYHFNFIENYKN